ncbi:MAG: hypothetical protein MSA91_07395 [Lachnobacterium sp.]|nr:hypothetical protein [Lachnobacterium sp.]
MKNKVIITLLALTMTTAMLAGCGKETAEVQSADTEAVAEVSTETKAVVAETETEESTEGAELVYNTETDTEVVAKEDKTKPDKADAKTDSIGSTKDSASKTDSKDAGTKTETKADSTKNDSATQAPAETTTNTPAETPAETPSEPTVSDQPTTGPEPTTAVCPYTVNTWMDMGDGWWGCYKDYIDSKTPEENATIQSEVNTWLMNKMANENLTYDNSSGELIGNYDGISSVQLDKFHLVPAPEGAYDPQD